MVSDRSLPQNHLQQETDSDIDRSLVSDFCINCTTIDSFKSRSQK